MRHIPGIDAPLPQDVKREASGRLTRDGRSLVGITDQYSRRGRNTVIRRSSGHYSGGRRGGGGGRGVLAAVLLAAAAIAALAWFGTRPSSVEVVVDAPKGASIKLADFAGSDQLLVEEIEPGEYALEVARKGFKTLDRKVTVRRWRREKVRVSLEALPFEVKVVTHPEGASVKFDQAGTHGDQPRPSPLNTTLNAGDYTVTVAMQGYNTFTQRVSIETTRTFDIWLDPEGQLVRKIAMFDCGPAPKGVAFTPDGKEAWVTMLGGPPSVEIYDPRTGEKAGGVDLGEDGAVEVAFSSDGKKAYASQMETARVYEIDVKTRKVLRTFDTESAWTKVVALSADDQTLFAANWSGDDVSEWDRGSSELRRRLPTVDTPRGLYPTKDGKTLWVAGFGKGEIERIDLGSGERTLVHKTGGAMRHLVADENRGFLYASDMAKNKVFKIELATGKTTVLAETDEKPNTIDLSPDGRVLFVSCRGANNPKSYYIPGPEWGSVLLIDTATGKVLDAIVGGNQCTALDVSADGKLLIFSDFLDNRLRVYEVPAYDDLLAGDGGRAESHKADIRKKNWKSSGGSGSGSSSGGD